MDPANGADDGELERHGSRAVVRFRRRFRHPPRKVWSALTEPDHLAAWFPTTVEGEREAGAPLHFGFRDMAAAPFDGEMLTFDPPALMAMQWGEQTLNFELEPHGEGSALVFTATFDEIGQAARDGAGWHACLDLLTYEVDDRTAPWSAADRWKQLRDPYIGRFGPDASTVGPPEEWDRAHGSDAQRS